MQLKQCSKCKEMKTLDSFAPNKRMKLGRSSWCCVCKAAHQRQYNKTKAGQAAQRRRRAKRKAAPSGSEYADYIMRQLGDDCD